MNASTMIDDQAARLERERLERLEQMELFDDHRFLLVDVALSGTLELRRDNAADRELLDGLTLGSTLDVTLDNGYVLHFMVSGRVHKLAASGEPAAKTTLGLAWIERPVVDVDDDEAEF